MTDLETPSWLTPTWTPRVGGDRSGGDRSGGAATVADVGEAGVLAAIMPHLAAADAEIGPGDDAAVLRLATGRTVVTTDSMVRGLDWRDDWSSAHDVGVKVIAQNLADVVAMGATPTGVVVALATEERTRVEWLVELTGGMADELRRAGCGSLGGDLSGAPAGTVVITVTALGALAPDAPVLTRDAARPGQVLVVSDRLGRSHAGLLVLRGEVGVDVDDDADAIARECVAFHRAPRPRYAGREAVAAGMRVTMDVSDGLGRDAARIARASDVGIELDRDALEAMAAPLRPLAGERALECVLTSGEEHALVGTCEPDVVPDGWHVIGRVTAASDAGPRVTLDGRDVENRGWSHYG